MPTCPYRGAGAPEAVFVIERLMDMAADAIGLSSAEIRRRNLVPAIPYKTAIGTTLDSGDFEQVMDRAGMAELPGYPARKVASEAKGAARHRLRQFAGGLRCRDCGPRGGLLPSGRTRPVRVAPCPTGNP